MRLVFLGPPGAGKGTQAKRVAHALEIPHISTGDMLRDSVRKGQAIGLNAKQYMDKGELVPDNVMLDVVKERIREGDCERGFLLDGFPRTISQAEGLDDILNGIGLHLDHVISIEVPEEELVLRLTSRRLCRQCGQDFNLAIKPPRRSGICDHCGGKIYQREDDSEETIRNRLQVYTRQTDPLKLYYRQGNLLRSVNGSGSIEEITDSILTQLRGERSGGY
jgi:adenylate kinase